MKRSRARRGWDGGRRDGRTGGMRGARACERGERGGEVREGGGGRAGRERPAGDRPARGGGGLNRARAACLRAGSALRGRGGIARSATLRAREEKGKGRASGGRTKVVDVDPAAEELVLSPRRDEARDQVGPGRELLARKVEQRGKGCAARQAAALGSELVEQGVGHRLERREAVGGRVGQELVDQVDCVRVGWGGREAAGQQASKRTLGEEGERDVLRGRKTCNGGKGTGRARTTRAGEDGRRERERPEKRSQRAERLTPSPGDPDRQRPPATTPEENAP